MSALLTPSWSAGFAPRDGPPANPDLRKGLLGNWVPRMGATGGTLFDVSGRKDHGTLTNMPMSAWQAEGLELGGRYSTDYVDFSGIVGDAEYPKTFHVRYETPSTFPTGANDKNIIVDRRSEGSYKYGLSYLSGTGVLYLVAQVFEGIPGAGGITGPVLSTGTWYSITAVFESLTSRTLYVDGALVETNTDSKSLGTSFTNTRIGASGNSQEPGGIIHSAGIWQRALNANESQQLHVDPLALTRLARRTQVAVAAPPAGGTVNPLSMGAVNLLAGKLAA